MELNFPKIEKKILKYWKENKTFEKSVKQRAKTRDFVFYEGPPTANAKAGIHHVLARVYKDIVCRYKVMRGFKVLRKAGWDTHGLPVELEIEKKLGLKSKKGIEKYGIAKFNQQCKKAVWVYKRDWEKITERIGFWLDMENPYITYQPDYIETVWWIIKQISKKGLIYQDYKVVPYCPRCGTSLSSHEVALGYKKIKEPAVYTKFKIKDLRFKNAYLLIWTTTPWTLPGNVAVAVNPNFIYVLLKTGDESLILAKERVKSCKIEGKIIKEFKGKELLGLKYELLYKTQDIKSDIQDAYKVISGDFVSLEEGTGLVHVAPAFGEEDMEAIKTQNSKLKTQKLPEFPILLNVDEEGKYKKEIKNWAGLFVKDADPLIIEDLKKRNLLFEEEIYEHDYPFCWRCSSPLLYYAKQSWFINMQKVKKDLIKNNQKINWIPAHLKKGRFGEWLREIKDWAFSRERYWGTPLPIWQCKKCGHREIIGSKKDLIKQKFTANQYFILRHAESLRNIQDVISCWPEKFRCPITPKGKKQIKRVAKKLKKKKIDLIFSSDLLRTRQTTEIVAKEIGIKPKFDKRLREINMGIFNGKSVKEAGKFWSRKGETPLEHYLKRFKIGVPGGENYMDVKKRMYQFLEEINQKYQNKNILIVSHEAPISILEGAVKGFSPLEIIKYRLGSQIQTGEYRKLDFKSWSYNQKGELDFHRPYIDKVKFYCPKCGNLMERVPEVIDCWFDSGSMPLAQYHYPFENKKLIDNREQFPADYISEAVDQTRGWFYTLLAISTLLKKGPAYKNVVSLGHILDEKGEKMSKSKGNAVDPREIIEKYGSDSLRWYFFTVNQPGDSKLFSEKEVEGCLKRFIMTLWNSFLFSQTYGQRFPRSYKLLTATKPILDRWIISKLNELIQEVTKNLDKYNITSAARTIENFVIEDLSQWYIRRSRKRFQRPRNRKELQDASDTLNYVLLTLTKLTAPFIPFLSEQLYQRCLTSNTKQSVHLENWPEINRKLINKKLTQKIEKIREIIKLALAKRARAGIKVRQPLNELQIPDYKLRNKPELLDLIREEINVKKITFGKTLKLDTKITPELKKEGMIREVIRQIQEMRKTAGLKPRHRILVQYFGSVELNKALEKNKKIILKEIKAKDFILRPKLKKVFLVEREVKVDQQKLWLAIKKI